MEFCATIYKLVAAFIDIRMDIGERCTNEHDFPLQKYKSIYVYIRFEMFNPNRDWIFLFMVHSVLFFQVENEDRRISVLFYRRIIDYRNKVLSQ